MCIRDRYQRRVHGSIHRDDHLTLSGNAYKMASILTMFFKQFYNQEFNEKFCNQFDFDAAVSLYYHKEDEELRFEQTLVDQFFAMIRVKKLQENSAQLTEFVEAFATSDFKPRDVSEEDIRNQLISELGKLGISFIFKKEEIIEQPQPIEEKIDQKMEEEEIKMN
eukprot:TRINITY_DN5595_c0_g1_i2.p1 TRINITY_DN5595_c0_g1~~TRINITY_DN5595_c0_g1_i2.p1  ORF type:complete len:165 (-),score=44.66 TRINITY_DN5595_c0_g1_i2:14-508(-)